MASVTIFDLIVNIHKKTDELKIKWQKANDKLESRFVSYALHNTLIIIDKFLNEERGSRGEKIFSYKFILTTMSNDMIVEKVIVDHDKERRISEVLYFLIEKQIELENQKIIEPILMKINETVSSL